MCRLGTSASATTCVSEQSQFSLRGLPAVLMVHGRKDLARGVTVDHRHSNGPELLLRAERDGGGGRKDPGCILLVGRRIMRAAVFDPAAGDGRGPRGGGQARLGGRGQDG